MENLLITEADMKMRFGSREEMITGTGLIGGGEASLTFKTSINACAKTDDCI